MKLAIVIPVYNEAKLLPRLLDRLVATPPPAAPVESDDPKSPGGHAPLTRTIYVVDDGSTDGTRDFLSRLPTMPEPLNAVRVSLHARNMGKGAAVRTGIAAALNDGADIVLIQDGDLEYDPRDHARVVRPILEGKADAVVGSRFLGEQHRVLYFWHSVANRFITLFSNMLTNLNLSDVECCLKAFTREVGLDLRLRENRFGIEPELVAKFARSRVPGESGGRRRARVFEVAVSYAGRTYSEGKKIGVRDGFAALWCIMKYNLLR